MKRIALPDELVPECPYCGCKEVIDCCQSSYGALCAVDSLMLSQTLYHSVCRDCGSVVRSYVKNPEMLLNKKDRRKDEE